MLHRECEVRVFQARHLVPRQKKRSDDEKSLMAGVSVLLSYDGLHVPTEVCRDIDNPTWQRVVSFQLTHQDTSEGEEALTEPSAKEEFADTAFAKMATTTTDKDVTQSLNPFAKTQSLNPFAKTQSLNPFASNFVPPPSPPTPTPTSTPAAQFPLRAPLVLHLHVLSYSLISKQVLGDVAIDLVPLLESRGHRLATDRLGHVGDVPLDGLPDAETIAVDTWVALRQRTGELRVQLLVKPAFSGAVINRGTERKRHSMHFAHLGGTSNGSMLAPGSSVLAPEATRAPEGGDLWAGHQLGIQDSLWSEFDKLARDGLVKTSLSVEQRSLDDRLLEVQELYDFSAACGYRQGRPDEDADGEGGNGAKGFEINVPEWPTCGQDAAQLRRDMQFATLRNQRQSIGKLVKEEPTRIARPPCHLWHVS